MKLNMIFINSRLSIVNLFGLFIIFSWLCVNSVAFRITTQYFTNWNTPLRSQSRSFIIQASKVSMPDSVDVNALPDCKRRYIELNKLIDFNMAKGVLDIGNLRESVRDMEQESAQPNFWV